MQAFNFVTALSPFSPTFDEDNQRDVRKRPAGPTQKPVYPNKPAEYLGTSKVSVSLSPLHLLVPNTEVAVSGIIRIWCLGNLI